MRRATLIREHPAIDETATPPLEWLAHGPYLLKGCSDPVEIFEVGAKGIAPLCPPPDGEKAIRAIRPGEEETLGWRPAGGLEIPGRPGWHLAELLGEGGFGEVWAGEHTKLRQRRAFKFCFDDERLRALKREVTLVRLLQSALGQRDDIVHLHELKLDEPPFYLESDLAPHGNLLHWAEKQGGLEKIPLERRIALVAHTATALAAAHSLGVLHKDIKPTNILIFDGPDGEPRPRLVDFGIGTLADPEVLGLHGVTSAGFTRATIAHSTGTPTYSPPEYLAGRPYTIQGDIYGLGVLLYQLVTAKPMDPLAPGWERDISDPLLREDIAACVDGDPARRLSNATELALRLSSLKVRHDEIAEKTRMLREVAARKDAEAAYLMAREKAVRFRKLATAFACLAILVAAAGIFALVSQRKATRAYALAEEARKMEVAARELAEANAHTSQKVALEFTSMFTDGGVEYSSGKTVIQMLDNSSPGLMEKWRKEPDVSAAIHYGVGLYYSKMGQWDKAQKYLSISYSLQEGLAPALPPQYLMTLQELASVAASEGDFESSRKWISLLRAAVNDKSSKIKFENTLGTVEALKLWTVRKLAQIYHAEGDFNNEKLMVQQLEIAIENGTLTGPQASQAWLHVANVAIEEGDPDRAFQICETHLKDYPRGGAVPTANVDKLKGMAHLEKKEFKEAEGFLLKALKVEERRFGNQHFITRETYKSLFALYKQVNRNDDAERFPQLINDGVFTKRIFERGDPEEQLPDGCLAAERFDNFTRGASGWKCLQDGNSSENAVWAADPPVRSGRGGGCFSAPGFPSNSQNNWFEASSAFLGDQAKSINGGIEFHLRLKGDESVGDQSAGDQPDIELESQGLRLVRSFKLPQMKGWQRVLVPFKDDGGWKIGSLGGKQATLGELTRVISKLEALRIRADYSSSGSRFADLDDVIIWNRERFTEREEDLATRKHAIEETMAWGSIATIKTSPNISWYHLESRGRVHFRQGIPWAEEFDGRQGLAIIHPISGKSPATVNFPIPPNLPAGMQIAIDVRGSNESEGNLIQVVGKNGVLASENVDNVWKLIKVPLEKAVGESSLRIEVHARGWYYEHCFIDDIRIARITDLLPPSTVAPKPWKYSTTTPAGGWHSQSFDDTLWIEGPGGFGVGGSPSNPVHTRWNSPDIWLRHVFQVPEGAKGRTGLTIFHDDRAEVFINGSKVATLEGWTKTYRHVVFPSSLLKSGANLIAIHCNQTNGGQYIDASIYLEEHQ